MKEKEKKMKRERGRRGGTEKEVFCSTRVYTRNFIKAVLSATRTTRNNFFFSSFDYSIKNALTRKNSEKKSGVEGEKTGK